MYTAAYIIQAVDRLVTKYGTRDPYDLCDAMHIVLYRKDMQKKLKGFFFYHSRQKSIVVDSNVNEILEKILVAHELGHAVLHKETAMMRGFQEQEVFEGTAKPMEYEANLFAAELLLEDKEVLDLLKEKTFFETAGALNVPAAFLDFKLVLLQARGKGFGGISPAAAPIGTKADFLKEDCGAYDNIRYFLPEDP